MPRAKKPQERRGSAGAKALFDWRTAKKLTQIEVCAQLELDGGRYSAYETGRLSPGLEIAAKIQVLTKGEVPATIWVKDPETARALAS